MWSQKWRLFFGFWSSMIIMMPSFWMYFYSSEAIALILNQNNPQVDVFFCADFINDFVLYSRPLTLLNSLLGQVDFEVTYICLIHHLRQKHQLGDKIDWELTLTLQENKRTFKWGHHYNRVETYARFYSIHGF